MHYELCVLNPGHVIQTCLFARQDGSRLELQVNLAATGAAGLSMVVAAGPFSSKDNAEYEPLQALLEHCSQQPPDVLVLLGAFVDADHPHIQAGTLQESYADLFAAQVSFAQA